MSKPLFIPLKSEHYEAFKNGVKRREFRLYGPRWNEQTCVVGRAVTLSKGYGKANRLNGTVRAFRKQHGAVFGKTYKAAILDCYGTLDVQIAVIEIDIHDRAQTQNSQSNQGK